MLDQAKTEIDNSKIVLECYNCQNQANFETSQISGKNPKIALKGTLRWSDKI